MSAEEPNEPQDDLTITGEMEVLRRIHPALVKPSTGEPDRSVFKDDPGGVGTSVTLWSSPDDVERVVGDHSYVGVVSIRVDVLRAVGLGICFTHEEGNPNHCEVFGPRTKGKLGQLRSQVRWVKYPPGYPEELKTALYDKFSED
jgi:hypothetical protein